MIYKVGNVRESRKLPNDYPTIIKSLYRGRFVCRNANCFHVTASEGLVNRAIRILDSLTKELENRKFKIQFIQDDSRNFIVAIKENEQISFHISEGYKYHPINNDHRSELDKLLYRDKEPIPTGKLTLTISALETKISKSWSDGIRLIEEELPNIINSFDSLILKQKERKVENAIKAEQRKDFTRAFKENESKWYLEKSIYDSAMQESQSFIAHINMESYLNYLEAQYVQEYGCLNKVTLQWFSTARKIAETQNPVNKRLKLLSSL